MFSEIDLIVMSPMQFGHASNIEDFALGVIPEQTKTPPDASSWQRSSEIPTLSLESGDDQQVENDALLHDNSAVLLHTSSSSTHQRVRSSPVGMYHWQSVTLDGNWDEGGRIRNGKWLRERAA